MITLAIRLIVLSIAHSACSGTPSPAATPSYPAASIATRPSAIADPSSSTPGTPTSTSLEQHMPPPLDYAPRGRRDPFTPVRAVAVPTRDRSILASAKLTGIVRGSDGALALVETIDGTGFILRAGEGFGEGRLLEIGEDFALFDVGSPSASSQRRIVLRLEPVS
jgi:hypothetical protein